MIEAIIFDFFETLGYTTETGTREVAKARLRAAGVADADWERAARATFLPTIRGELRSLEERVREELRLAGVPDPDPGLVGEVTTLFAGRHEFHLYPDVAPTLEELRRRGLRLGLISNIGFDECVGIDALELRDAFDARVLSCEVGLAKPDPAIFRLAAERLGTPPERCAFVDDRLDYLSRLGEVGMTAVHLARPSVAPRGGSEGRYDLRIASLQELLEWLPAKRSFEA